MRKCLPFIIVVFMLIAPLNSTAFRARMDAMDTEVNLIDMPKHGLFLIGQSDPSFEEYLVTALGDQGSKISDTAKLLSVIVNNSSRNSVVAYHLKWELTGANGKTVSHERSYADPALLMENRKNEGERFVYLGSNSIKPNSYRFLSLVPFLIDVRLRHGSIGGGNLGLLDPDQVGSVRRALQERNVTEAVKKLTEKLGPFSSVTVTIDGAFFDDGTFIGPDESGYFSRFKAQLDARYDLYKELLAMVGANKPSQEILQRLTSYAALQRQHLGPRSSPSEFYSFHRKLYAEDINRLWKISGSETAIRYVESSLSKPWATLRKLQ